MSAALAVLYVLVAAVAFPRPRCKSRHWFPYSDADGFGYAEWRCDRPYGHAGDHESEWRA